jgi:hypothetical protein
VYRVSSRKTDVRMRCKSKYLLIVLLLFLSICRNGAANSGFKGRRLHVSSSAVFFSFDFNFDGWVFYEKRFSRSLKSPQWGSFIYLSIDILTHKTS